MQTEKEQVIAALTSEKDQLTKDLNTQAQRCQEIQVF